MGIEIRRNAYQECSTSEKVCVYLDNGICEKCTCDKCIGGVVLDKENGAARRCSCSIEAVNRNRFKKTGLRARDTFENYYTDTPWQETVKRTALSFAADKNARGFFISGQSGSGKTHICTAIIQTLPARGSIRIFRWVSDATRLKSLVNETDRYSEELQPYKDADILYIDDLFKTLTDADLRLAFEIIDDRCNRGRVTIISSERNLSEIRDMKDGDGEAVAGRIKELCGQYCLNLSGRDKNQRFKEDR